LGSGAFASACEELTMSPLYVVGGGISLALLIYLFVALLAPEKFS
jgi:K+-transporting ATPase KdpF subunit